MKKEILIIEDETGVHIKMDGFNAFEMIGILHVQLSNATDRIVCKAKNHDAENVQGSVATKEDSSTKAGYQKDNSNTRVVEYLKEKLDGYSNRIVRSYLKSWIKDLEEVKVTDLTQGPRSNYTINTKKRI